jgi:hypothetical protein
MSGPDIHWNGKNNHFRLSLSLITFAFHFFHFETFSGKVEKCFFHFSKAKVKVKKVKKSLFHFSRKILKVKKVKSESEKRN